MISINKTKQPKVNCRFFFFFFGGLGRGCGVWWQIVREELSFAYDMSIIIYLTVCWMGDKLKPIERIEWVIKLSLAKSYFNLLYGYSNKHSHVLLILAYLIIIWLIYIYIYIYDLISLLWLTVMYFFHNTLL